MTGTAAEFPAENRDCAMNYGVIRFIPPEYHGDMLMKRFSELPSVRL